MSDSEFLTESEVLDMLEVWLRAGVRVDLWAKDMLGDMPAIGFELHNGSLRGIQRASANAITKTVLAAVNRDGGDSGHNTKGSKGS